MRVYHPSKEAQDAARSSPLSFFFPITKKDRDHYLRAAGRHWLISLGLGATGAAVGYFSDWEPGVTRAITVGTLIGAAGFQVMVPLDLILAGSAEK